jgi:hypothetical protein
LPGQFGCKHRPAKQVSFAAHGVSGQVTGEVQTPPSPHTWSPMQSAVLLHLMAAFGSTQLQPLTTRLAKASATRERMKATVHQRARAIGQFPSGGIRRVAAGGK